MTACVSVALSPEVNEGLGSSVGMESSSSLSVASAQAKFDASMAPTIQIQSLPHPSGNNMAAQLSQVVSPKTGKGKHESYEAITWNIRCPLTWTLFPTARMRRHSSLLSVWAQLHLLFVSVPQTLENREIHRHLYTAKESEMLVAAD